MSLANGPTNRPATEPVKGLATKPQESTSLAGGRLLGDLGGTHTRLAWQDTNAAPLRNISVYKARDYASPLALIEHYLNEHQLPRPIAICLGIACAAESDQINMTNLDWSFSLRALGQSLGTDRIWAINDFAAIAYAVPRLQSDERQHTGGPNRVDRSRPIALLGAGTGLGVASLVPDGRNRYIVVPGEGGHITLAATNDREWALLRVIARNYGHVSAERILSGAGLSALAAAIAEVDANSCVARTPAEVISAALRSDDPVCTEAVRVFTRFLGNVAGNLALTLGAHAGVYIGGGIVPRLLPIFDWALFRQALEDKGRFAAYLRDVPSYLITAHEPGLIGAAAALDERL